MCNEIIWQNIFFWIIKSRVKAKLGAKFVNIISWRDIKWNYKMNKINANVLQQTNGQKIKLFLKLIKVSHGFKIYSLQNE